MVVETNVNPRRLFVAMPYGKRKALLDSERSDTITELDFDAVWNNILRPGIPDGFLVKRADELRQPGLIDRLYSEWLYEAHIVLADLTFANPNVYYELGIRQALSRKATILVACQGTSLPFDIRNQYVIYYDYFSATRVGPFQEELKQTIENVPVDDVDSPVHVYLPGLFIGRGRPGESPIDAAAVLERRFIDSERRLQAYESREAEERLRWKLEDAITGARVVALAGPILQVPNVSVSLLELLAIKLRKFGFVDQALDVLRKALEQQPADAEILREIGFAYRKKGPSFYTEAETYMLRALDLNERDAELHGMYGGLLKRRQAYGDALMHYKRASELEPSNLYALVNLGAIHAALGNQNEARRSYQLVASLCEQIIAAKTADYWTYLCRAEAHVVGGNIQAAVDSLAIAKTLGVPVEDIRSATEQLEYFVGIGFEADAARFVLATFNASNDSTSPLKAE